MPATTLRCDLLSMTPDAEALIYAAARQCYSADDAADIFARASNTDNTAYSDHTKMQQEVLIRRVIDSGHDSVAEHVSFSFAISGISRALSHQLVRHRIASYSQQSQRYVSSVGFSYITPNKVFIDDDACELYQDLMRRIEDVYSELVGAYGIPAEDARYVLPNACETKVVVTMNARALLHFFELRCCVRAQWEIRAMANAMLAICREKLPVVFQGRGARCKRLGYCPEGEHACAPHKAKMKQEGE